MEITINNIEYTIDISKGKLEASFDNPETGLKKLYVFNLFEIELKNKRIKTEYYAFDVAPSGQLINRQAHAYTSVEADFDDFEDGPLGAAIKKAATNGLFRYLFKNTHRVFTEDGQLISEQPVEALEEEV